MKNELSKMLKQASLHLNNGEYFKAKIIIDHILLKKHNDVEALLMMGIIEAMSGNYENAIEIFSKGLKYNNTNTYLLFNRGNAYGHWGKHTEAINDLEKLLLIDKSNAQAMLVCGNSYLKNGNINEAIIKCRQAISVNKKYYEAYVNLGNIYQMKGQLEDALSAYDEAIKINENIKESYLNKGNVLQELKRYPEAIISYKKGIKLDPNYAQCYCNLGNAYQEMGEIEESIVCYQNALKNNEKFVDAYFCMGNSYAKARRLLEAISCYNQVLKINSQHIKSLNNRGNVYKEMNMNQEALASYDEVISINEKSFGAYFKKAKLYEDLNMYSESLINYQKVTSSNPEYIDAIYNRGNVFLGLRRYEDAIKSYEQIIKIKPDYNYLLGTLLHAKMQICDWSKYKEYTLEIENKAKLGEKVIPPFAWLALSDSILDNRAVSETLVLDKFKENNKLGAIKRRVKNIADKITVGYFSADFREHPVAYLSAELFELHSRNEFNIIGFYYGPNDDSEIHKRISNSFDEFINVRNIDDETIAKLSRDKLVDIAVDLTGHTEGGRVGIFSYRAAPIQLNYLGFPSSIGAKYYDYIIADKLIIPHELSNYYCEKVVYLDSYQVNDSKRKISDRKYTKGEWGLPEESFVFCCFNSCYKILPSTFDSWMRILSNSDKSVLWLSSQNTLTIENLKKEAENRGINSERIVFASRIDSMSEHLARYKVADLFLDTFPFNAHTTASDALWAGLPVLTMMGQSFASRVAASLLTAIDLPELITENREKYEALAVELVNNPERLMNIKSRLYSNRMTSKLFNTPMYAKNLDDAYLKLYKNHINNLAIDHIY